VDGKANAVEDTDRPHLERTTSPQPRTLRAFLDRTKDRPGLALRGLIKRAPPSPADIAPEGAKFIESSYSNRAGRLDYKLLIPSASTLVDFRPEQPLLLSWEQHIAICTRQSVCILVLPAGSPLTFLLQSSRCGKAATPMVG